MQPLTNNQIRSQSETKAYDACQHGRQVIYTPPPKGRYHESRDLIHIKIKKNENVSSSSAFSHETTE